MGQKAKLMGVEEAVDRFIKEGSHIGFGGFSLSRNSMIISHEIIRKRIGNLHISSVNPAYGVDILIGAGLVEVVESGCLNMEMLGLPRNFCRAVEAGKLKSVDYEHGAMTLRYLAGALGLPFIPVNSMMGSDIVKYLVGENPMVSLINCPFSGKPAILLPACTPDVAVIHVTRSDEEGNAQIDGSAFSDQYIAKSAQRIILVTEEVAPTEVIRRKPEDTIIPGYRTDAVVHAPWGAYPTAVPGCYDYDYEALQEYQDHARSPEKFKLYLAKYVYGTSNFEEYLDKAATPSRYQRLRIDPRLGYSSYTTERINGTPHEDSEENQEGKNDEKAYTLHELMIIAAAREIKDGEIIIAGTGLPMVATTLAKLHHAPNCIYVVETGIGDLRPRHSALSVADPRLTGAAGPAFDRDILESLGFLVQKGLADIGFLGGAQIDKYGNLNATMLGDYKQTKKRFPGSGGANMIASCAKRIMVIMKQEKRRFVERVDYITSPGYINGGNARQEHGLTGGGPHRVITDLGIMGFDPESKMMQVISLHPGVGRERISEATDFELLFPDDIPSTPAPSAEELKILRSNTASIYLKG